MTLRQPAPPVPGRPDCYGLAHAPTLALCRGCTFRRMCRHVTAGWAQHASLSEQLAEAWRTTYRAGVEADSARAIFAALWEQHYGSDFFFRRPDQLRTAKQRQYYRRAVAAAERAADTCRARGLDLATFITAQMDTFAAMRARGEHAWIRRAKTFPVNWLSGKGALPRYRVYLTIAYRQMRRARADALDHCTTLGRLREQLAADEEAVAAEFCRAWRTDGTATWDASVAAVQPSDTWRAVTARQQAPVAAVRQHYRRLRTRYGEARLVQEHRLATLRSAFALAETVQHGLPDRIGFTDWSWPSFARLLTRVVGPLPHVTDRPVLDGALGGRLWGASSGDPARRSRRAE